MVFFPLQATSDAASMAAMQAPASKLGPNFNMPGSLQILSAPVEGELIDAENGGLSWQVSRRMIDANSVVLDSAR